MFVTVRFFTALMSPTAVEVKEKLVVDVVTGNTPVPLSDAVWGLLAALSATDNVPVNAPVAVGLKVSEIEHFVPVARVDPQMLVSAKSPVTEIFEIASGAVPLLVSFTDFAELAYPVASEPKLTLEVESAATGAGVGVGDGLGVGERLAVGVGGGVGDGDGLAVGEGDGIGVGEGVGEGEGDAVGVGLGDACD